MRFQDFEINIKMLSSWLNKKLSDAQLELMFDDLQHVPGEAFTDICGDVRRSKAPNTAFPSVNDFMISWDSWQKAHSDKIIRDERVWCEACKAVGYFIVGYAPNGSGGLYKGQVNCAACSNNQGQGIIRLSIAEIERRGWSIDENDQPVTPIGEGDRKRNLRPLVDWAFHDPREWEEV